MNPHHQRNCWLVSSNLSWCLVTASAFSCPASSYSTLGRCACLDRLVGLVGVLFVPFCRCPFCRRFRRFVLKSHVWKWTENSNFDIQRNLSRQCHKIGKVHFFKEGRKEGIQLHEVRESTFSSPDSIVPMCTKLTISRSRSHKILRFVVSFLLHSFCMANLY